MDQVGLAVGGGPSGMEGLRFEWAAFIQQQIQLVFQAAIPHIVQQIYELAVVPPPPTSSSVAARVADHGYDQNSNGRL